MGLLFFVHSVAVGTRDGRVDLAQVLLVVSREAPNLLERFSKEFESVEAVTVLRDRRVGERRRREDANGAERRRSDRRQRTWADTRLRSDGWALSDALTEESHPAPVVVTLPAADPRKV